VLFLEAFRRNGIYMNRALRAMVVVTTTTFSHFFRDESKFDDTSKHVFTDVSIKLCIKEV